jgi:hypothetical protein
VRTRKERQNHVIVLSLACKGACAPEHPCQQQRRIRRISRKMHLYLYIFLPVLRRALKIKCVIIVFAFQNSMQLWHLTTVRWKTHWRILDLFRFPQIYVAKYFCSLNTNPWSFNRGEIQGVLKRMLVQGVFLVILNVHEFLLQVFCVKIFLLFQHKSVEFIKYCKLNMCFFFNFNEVM